MSKGNRKGFPEILFNTLIEKVKKANVHTVERIVNFIMREALFLGIMLYLWQLTGKIKVWADEVDPPTTKTFGALQREAWVDSLKSLRDLCNFTFPLINIAPLKAISPHLDIWISLLAEAERPSPGAPQYTAYYVRFPFFQRTLIVLIVPGALRALLHFSRDLMQLIDV